MLERDSLEFNNMTILVYTQPIPIRYSQSIIQLYWISIKTLFLEAFSQT